MTTLQIIGVAVAAVALISGLLGPAVLLRHESKLIAQLDPRDRERLGL